MTTFTERQSIIEMITECIAAGARQNRACAAIGLSEKTLQRWEANDVGDKRPMRIQKPVNQLSECERQRILETVNSAEYAHLPPNQIVPILADKGIYIGSESTIYRVLKASGQIQHRHKARPARVRNKPKALSATAPNQLYSWDITYLHSPVRGVYFYLYLFLDVFSRYIVGWQVYEAESSELAGDLMRDICARHAVLPHQVVLHSDNGGPMKGSSMLATLQGLGVASSFSRPAVSNDNPYSEALFKTLKYCPSYPHKSFTDLSHARRWTEQFVNWYNNEHRHSGIAYVTPAQRHAGEDVQLLAQRQSVYEAAKAQNPLRWSGAVRDWDFISEVYLNPDNANHLNKLDATTLKLAA